MVSLVDTLCTREEIVFFLFVLVADLIEKLLYTLALVHEVNFEGRENPPKVNVVTVHCTF